MDSRSRKRIATKSHTTVDNRSDSKGEQITSRFNEIVFLYGANSTDRKQDEPLERRLTSVADVLQQPNRYVGNDHRATDGITLIQKFRALLKTSMAPYEPFDMLITFLIDEKIVPPSPSGSANDHFCIRLGTGGKLFHIATKCKFAAREGRHYQIDRRSIIGAAALECIPIMDNMQELNQSNPKQKEDKGALLTIPLPLIEDEQHKKNEDIVQLTCCHFSNTGVFEEWHLAIFQRLLELARDRHLILQYRVEKETTEKRYQQFSPFDPDSIQTYARLLDEEEPRFSQAFLIPGHSHSFSRRPLLLPTIRNTFQEFNVRPFQKTILENVAGFTRASCVVVSYNGSLTLHIDNNSTTNPEIHVAPVSLDSAVDSIQWPSGLSVLIIPLRKASTQIGFLWIERDSSHWDMQHASKLAKNIVQNMGTDSLRFLDQSHIFNPLPSITPSKCSQRLHEELSVMAANAGHPVLLVGEPGCGKRFYAWDLHKKTMYPFTSDSLSVRTYETVDEGTLPNGLPHLLNIDLVEKEQLFGTVVLIRPNNYSRDLLKELRIRATVLASSPILSKRVRMIAICDSNPDLDIKIPEAEEFIRSVFASRGSPIRVPSLRERRDDIETIVRFWFEFGCFKQLYPKHVIKNPMVYSSLRERDWFPDNLIALRGTVERMCLHANWRGRDADLIEILPEDLTTCEPPLLRDGLGSPLSRTERFNRRVQLYPQIVELRKTLTFEEIAEQLTQQTGKRIPSSTVKNIFYTGGKLVDRSTSNIPPSKPNETRGGIK